MLHGLHETDEEAPHCRLLPPEKDPQTYNDFGMPGQNHPLPPPRGRNFPTTSWSLILAAASTSARKKDALAELCQAYWYPVYAFVRRHGSDASQAEDLTQEFFVRLIEKNHLQDADRNRGRF